MKCNPRRQRQYGGGRAYSLINSQRDVRYSLIGDEAETVHVLDIRNDHRMMATETEIYSATYNSFEPANRRACRSEVLRELLAEGTVLANLKGIFWTKAYWAKRKARTLRRAA